MLQNTVNTSTVTPPRLDTPCVLRSQHLCSQQWIGISSHSHTICTICTNEKMTDYHCWTLTHHECDVIMSHVVFEELLSTARLVATSVITLCCDQELECYS